MELQAGHALGGVVGTVVASLLSAVAMSEPMGGGVLGDGGGDPSGVLGDQGDTGRQRMERGVQGARRSCKSGVTGAGRPVGVMGGATYIAPCHCHRMRGSSGGVEGAPFLLSQFLFGVDCTSLSDIASQCLAFGFHTWPSKKYWAGCVPGCCIAL
jgi:hypothetical protein